LQKPIGNHTLWWSHITQLVVATFYGARRGGGVPSLAEVAANTKKKSAICNDRKVANGTNLAVKTSGQTSISTVLQKGHRKGRGSICIIRFSHVPRNTPTFLVMNQTLWLYSEGVHPTRLCVIYKNISYVQ